MQRRLPFGRVELGQRRLDRRAAGVVDPDVEVTELAHRCGGERLDGAVVGHVGGDCNGLATPRPNPRRNPFNLVEAPSRAHDGCARVGQYCCDALTDAATGASTRSNGLRREFGRGVAKPLQSPPT